MSLCCIHFKICDTFHFDYTYITKLNTNLSLSVYFVIVEREYITLTFGRTTIIAASILETDYYNDLNTGRLVAIKMRSNCGMTLMILQ